MNETLDVYSLNVQETVSCAKAMINTLNEGFYSVLSDNTPLSKDEIELYSLLKFLCSSLFVLNVNDDYSINNLATTIDKIVEMKTSDKQINRYLIERISLTIKLFNSAGGDIVENDERQSI